jgi:hypothetical protein
MQITKDDLVHQVNSFSWNTFNIIIFMSIFVLAMCIIVLVYISLNQQWFYVDVLCFQMFFTHLVQGCRRGCKQVPNELYRGFFALN